MDQHPALGRVLEEAGVGCTSCSLGTCRVQDILEIHDLDTVRTHALLQRMGEVIYGDRPFEVPPIERKASEPRSAFCPPIARMVEEHTHIKRLLALLPALIGELGRDWDAAAPLVARSLDFIRQYADRYHHAKEEDLLFAYFDRESDILRVMVQDHVEGRDHVRCAAEGLEARDPGRVAHHLRAYGELLTGHIHREDTILYPWMDRTLTTRQVGELYGECLAVERRFGAMPREQEAFVAELEARYRLG
jgi:hemerythrin-like domain-containing protein